MYERWAEVIGGMLDVARVPGFLENLEDFYDAADVEGDAVRWFIENWRMRHGATPVKVSDVADWALEPGSLVLTLLPTTSDRGLRTAFSLWVRSIKDRVFVIEDTKVRVEAVRTLKKSATSTWRVASMDEEVRLPGTA